MTRMRLVELRQLIEWEMLIEGADVGALAARGLKSRGVVVHGEGDAEWIVVVSRTETEYDGDNELPKVLGGAEGEREGAGSWAMRTLFADDPVTAIVVLAAALGHWERVVPDRSVSPAAKAVIKRYYDANKDDWKKVDQEVDDHTGARPQYLDATYLGPLPGFNLGAALENGKAVVDDAVDNDDEESRLGSPRKVRSMLVKRMMSGFQDAYQDPDKTKRPLPDYDKMFEKALSSKSAVDRSALMYKIQDGLHAPAGGRYNKATITWVDAHRDELDVFFQSIKYWSDFIVPRLDRARR